MLRATRTEVTDAQPSPTRGLAAPEDTLPGKLTVGEKAPAGVLRDQTGRRVTVAELASESDGALWLVFWASWCPDCERQFKSLREMEALAASRGCELLLVDRLNGKESEEAAAAKMSELAAASPWFFDDDETLYQAWGMREIPSTVVLSRDCRVLDVCAGVMSVGEYEGMLERALNGRTAATEALISGRFSNGRGGICTSTRRRSSPSGEDVLSESQGLAMQYALQTGNWELFDSCWVFVRDNMMQSGLPCWYVDSAGKKASSDALLDDMRIWYCLHRAAKIRGGAYAEDASALLSAMHRLCDSESGELYSAVDFKTGRHVGSVPLCYLDLEILDAMAEEDDWFYRAPRRARELLAGGVISDEFPLCYASYDYEAHRYGEEELNTAEALVALWNLSRAGRLPAHALDWLRERVELGELAARYRVDGSVAENGAGYSTAVYGLASLIARQEGDETLAALALRRMERYYVLDTAAPMYGSYSVKGAEASAYDQLIPLLALAAACGGTV